VNIHQDIDADTRFRENCRTANVITNDHAKRKFEAYRRTLHPDMKWNPFVHRVTRELQQFGLAYEKGKRPKLARIIHDSDLLFHLRAVHARHLPILIN